ncbi:hypothetical protein [Knoellia sp. Soil729]|uniref:hypothetical protein n=1 Tax=Knoellia sp. Soil729 TaxID=1736394 RepID=UPI001F1DA0CD|nr:hypothetical protein [Knoellia sp. Soil729]
MGVVPEALLGPLGLADDAGVVGLTFCAARATGARRGDRRSHGSSGHQPEWRSRQRLTGA